MAAVGRAQTKILLDEERHPDPLVQHRPRPAASAGAGAAPRHRPAHRPGRPRAAVSDGAHRPGGLAGQDRSRSPTRCATSTACGGRRPLFRARRLERALDTPAHIYYKYEGVSPAGSHKPNTAVAQAYYNKAEGIRRLTTETGAGQWGSALAFACALFGLECTVYMVNASYHQKPYRRSMIQLYGAEVFPAPSHAHPVGPEGAGRRIPIRPAAWASPSRRRSRTRRPTTTPTTRSAQCSTTCCCTRRSSARKRSSRWTSQGSTPTW